MTRVQFLNDLYRRLATMSKEEAEEHLTYYAEMLADRMEEGMTEEEAVASMEDVETIARRILQEAGKGVEQVSPFDTEHDGPQVAERKKNSRRRWGAIAVAVLLVLSALPVAALVGLFSFNTLGTVSQDGIRIDTEDGYVSIGEDGIRIEDDGDIVSIGPSGITVNQGDSATAITPNGAFSNEQVEESYTASDREPYLVPTRGIRSLQVDWAAGDVRIQPWEGEDIRLTELFADGTRTDKAEYFDYVIDEGELEVRFSKSRRMTGEKLLIVEIPADLAKGALGECEIETASANVMISDVTFSSVSVETDSGNVVMEGSNGHMDVDTGSGNVMLQISEAQKPVEVDTGSGNVTLTLPGDMTPNLQFQSGTGKLQNLGGFAFTGGGLRLDVETGTGDLRLLARE